jgi:beta-glucosidase
MTAAPHHHPAFPDLVARLTLEQKVRLLTGASAWSLHEEPAVGLRALVVSDGPTGVRGQALDDRAPSAALPSATAIAASWDLDRVRELGRLIAAEARAKGVDVVLGPTINLHRSPRGGRHFEAYSEDPWLTGELAAAYVESLQEQGVGATPKHYIANDSETDRQSVDVRVDERTLRELYLAPFERAVEAGAWLVMSSYNQVNGAYAAANELLRTPLKSEWGFDGVVVSDWGGVKDTDGSANAAQDLVMPGPDGPWGEALVAAVRAGRVPEAAIDEKVERLLRLAARVGALEGAPAAREVPAWTEERTAGLLREAAADGMVLARNKGVLPLTGTPRIAVLGGHALRGRHQGGGSAMVFPAVEHAPLAGIAAAFPGTVHAPGIPPEPELRPFTKGQVRTPDGGPGTLVRYVDEDGETFATEVFPSGRFGWLFDPTLARAARIEFRTTYVAPATGRRKIGFSALGAATLRVDGKTLFDQEIALEGDDVILGVLHPPVTTFAYDLVEGQELRIELDVRPFLPGGVPFSMIMLGTDEVFGDPETELVRAVEAARDADVAVVVVGTTETIESEGHDRRTLALPAGQDELVRRVAAVNDRTIVVVNAGAPVLMPWLDEVSAVLLSWFPGQEFGTALADVLTGAKEPGGRLTTTWPAAEADVPVWTVEPTDGRLSYEEGLHIGYRAWARRAGGPAPALAFGSGLGYTDWRVADARITADAAGGARVTATVSNIGGRAGKQVVQAFISRADDSGIERPALWLAGFAVVRAEAGTDTTITIDLAPRAFQHWSVPERAWITEPGRYAVRLGTGVDALGEELIVTPARPAGE